MSTTNGGLTAKQARFCEEYMLDMNATAAARRSGYSQRTAEQQGYQLLQKTSVKAPIADLQDKTSKRLEVTADDVMRMLLESYRDAKAVNQHGPAVRAAELLGKRLGMFKDRFLVNDMARVPTDVLIKRIAGNDPRRLAMARELYAVPDGFEEDSTRH